MWLGECIANWTGIQTEGDRTGPPFYTDRDWSSIGFVLNQNPWLADDDTDIEYVYVHLLNEHSTTTLSPNQIRYGWMKHINEWIWVSNAKVRSMFDEGVLPPATSLLNANELAIQIDAQLTTEIFGALAPGMTHKALQMANLPILTTASSYAAHASQFHVLLYSLASRLDKQLPPRDQALWLVDEASKYIPSTSKIIDIVNFVKADFLSNPDVNDWESTRDKIYERYQHNAQANGFKYHGWVESSINFAAGIMALLYGEMDYRRTIQIGTLAGWDSDNPTATLGGLLGLVYGYDQLIEEFPEVDNFSDEYNVYRTRDALPDYLPQDPNAEDTFTMMANRMLSIIDLAVDEANGTVQGNTWFIPDDEGVPIEQNPLYKLMQNSANNIVRSSGGMVTAISSIGGTNINAIIDGFEHNFNGEEWFGETSEFLSDKTTSAIITVTYNQTVTAKTIRVIEGKENTGYISADIKILQNGSWISPNEVLQYTLFDPVQAVQIIDYELATPLDIEGIRISGEINGRLNILEFDAFSVSLNEGRNIPPDVSIISPETGARFDPPANIIINADAIDRDGQIVKVEFFGNSELIGVDLTSPYSVEWNNLSEGVFQFSVRATDDEGEISVSDSRWIIVGETTLGDTVVWHSYDVNTIAENQPLLLYDQENKSFAVLELYESVNDGGVVKGNLFSGFNSGQHEEDFNKLENFWSNSSDNYGYPYIGKSIVDRGQDSGENNAPLPLGVRDLQMHPPDNDHLTVAAFVIPFEGDYRVSDLAVRRVHNEGVRVGYKVFNSAEEQISNLEASNDRLWVVDNNLYDLGRLAAGDRIYFAVDRGNNDEFYWDATEVSWTITLTNGISTDVENDLGETTPKEFKLNQNYPNPFNPSTKITYSIPKQSRVLLKVYDALGKEVSEIVDDVKNAGSYEVDFSTTGGDVSSLSSGVYLYRITAGQFSLVRKMLLVK
jgi:hypothetical protein